MGKRALTLSGVALILLGCLALVYGEISYTQKEKVLDLGTLEASMDVPKRIDLPHWVGGLVVAGGVALVIAGVRRP